MESFSTTSSSGRNLAAVICTFAVLFALAFFAIAITLAAWIFFECILLAVFAVVFITVKKTYWKLELHGSTLLLLNNGNGQGYRFDGVSADDIRITQSEGQKKKDLCDIKIADAPFAIYDAANCAALMAYIKENLS